MISILRSLLFVFVLKPFVLVVLGTTIRRRELLPRHGPALLVTNHNSHLDTAVLMSLFPRSMLPLLRPVAAADYFLRNKLLAWFALRIVGIIPIERRSRTHEGGHPLASCVDALDRGEILIVYPEGTRGEPEQMSDFQSGIAHLAKCKPDVPVIPIYMYGLGSALPRGEALFVPYICHINVGQPIGWTFDKSSFMQSLECAIGDLGVELKAERCDLEDEEDIPDAE